MFSIIEDYIGIIKVNLKNALAFKADYLLSLVFSIAISLLMIFLWTAVFANTNITSIDGFTLQLLYVYFFVISIAFTVSNSNMEEAIQSNIQDGTIAIAIIRPVNYIVQLVLGSIADRFLEVLVAGVPLFLIVTLFFHLSFTPLSLALFIAELILGYAIANLMSFLIGTLAIFITEVYGLGAVTWSIIYLLGGAIIPLSFFPNAISNILYLLPFQNMSYLPTIILLGLATSTQIIQGTIVGIVWAVALFIFSYFWWKRVKKHITSVGG